MAVFNTLWGHLQQPAITVGLRNGIRIWVTYSGLYVIALMLVAALTS